MTVQIVEDVVYGADDLIDEWMAQTLGKRSAVPFTGLGIVSGDRLVLGAKFFNQYAGDITLAMVAKPEAGFKRRAFARLMAYPFNQLGLVRVTAEIPLSNVQSINAAQWLGFVREGVKRRAAPDGGHVGVFGLLRKDFRFKGLIDGRA